MNKRIIQADWVYPMTSEVLENGAIAINTDGSIAALLPENEVPETAEQYKGVLCPGFVNAHCHLELSHLEGKIPQHTTLPGFIEHLQKLRKETEELIVMAAEHADQMMWNNGIQAVGDISNTAFSFPAKVKSRICYHTFIEVFSLGPSESGRVMDRAKNLKKEHLDKVGDRCTLVPHAPYSLSDALFAAIGAEQLSDKPLSIHNQETGSENLMFVKGEGALYDLLKKYFTKAHPFVPTGKSSLVSTLQKLSPDAKYIMVHNTFTSKDDMEAAEQYFTNGVNWCLCPSANRYIEERCPNILPHLHPGHVCVGTDSLASNTGLSVLNELKLLQEYLPETGADQLLKWGTLNGARALEMLPSFGCFQKNSKPGVLLIQNIVDNRLTSGTTVRRLV